MEEEFGDEPRIGGYDVVFVDEVSPRQTCPVCLLAMRNPVQTVCGHRFCESCLLETFRYIIICSVCVSCTSRHTTILNCSHANKYSSRGLVAYSTDVEYLCDAKRISRQLIFDSQSPGEIMILRFVQKTGILSQKMEGWVYWKLFISIHCNHQYSKQASAINILFNLQYLFACLSVFN